MRSSLRGAALVASFAGIAAAQPATFKGVVLVDSVERPIAGAVVAIDALKLQVTSDALGRFVMLGVAPGVHTVVARKIGFTPLATRVVFGTGATVDADLILSPNSAQALPEVTVETKQLPLGKMAEFEERRLAGFGRFMTQADLEKRSFGVLSSALRMMPGLEVQGKGRDQWIAAGRMSQPGGALTRTSYVPCPVAIVLDGSFIFGAGEANEPKFQIDQINPAILAGIEFYVGPAAIPMKWNATRHTCGLLVLWTK